MLRRLYICFVAMVVCLMVQQPACAMKADDGVAKGQESCLVGSQVFFSHDGLLSQAPSVPQMATGRTESVDRVSGRRTGFDGASSCGTVRTVSNTTIGCASQLHGTACLIHVPPCDYYVFTLRKLLI